MDLTPTILHAYLLSNHPELSGRYLMEKVTQRTLPFFTDKTSIEDIITGKKDGIRRGIAGLHHPDPRIILAGPDTEYSISSMEGKCYIGLNNPFFPTEKSLLFEVEQYNPRNDCAILFPITDPKRTDLNERIFDVVSALSDTALVEEYSRRGKDFNKEVNSMVKKCMDRLKRQISKVPRGTTLQ